MRERELRTDGLTPHQYLPCSFCLMHSANFGISGDRTENVLWRLHNGELEDVSPKIIVLSVGQENYGDSPDNIAEGIRAICAFIRSKQPQAFLVLLVTSQEIFREK